MATKVLVVDDSITMRALISGALEKISGIQVVGTADSAAEARAEVDRLRPDVMTLDVEMPGMSGIEYLEELMQRQPMPVIMFSARTEAGAEASIEALRLGAIDCFPKPKVATQDEFGKLLSQIAKRLKTAKTVPLQRVAVTPAVATNFDWNGRILAIGSDEAGTQTLFDLLGSFPANCPPTIVVQHMRPELLDTLAVKLREHVQPKVLIAEDGLAVEPGCIYLARSDEHHIVVDKWPGGTIRALQRDPVAGHRPSISLLFASLCASKADAVGLLLSPAGDDGPAGLKAMVAAGGYAIAPTGLLDEGTAADGFTLQKGSAAQPVGRSDLVAGIIKLCGK
ncbi:response regulator [Sphingomonas sp. AP4-R1]|uniref:chemotaxis protein CheB n=1 Tax=Sphingomonas sp. AP4-R1 TaxID=2735134 RepID=UPI001493347A|nr:chemotaxis protein CheB [Sphingomonas sp. AP4-R1]QJU58863.1 response regulator [Sphingomonas sp. AP4-R1]